LAARAPATPRANSAPAKRSTRTRGSRSSRRASMDRRCAAALLALATGGAPAAAAALQPYAIAGDSIPKPLGGLKGDPARGRAIVVDRQKGLCLLCHAGPFPEQRFQGDIAPSLAGAGSRLSEGQLRLRMVDSTRINPQSAMPSYYRIDHLT